MKIEELKPFQDTTAILHLNTGEITTVEIAFVDTEHEDIIVNILHTNRPEAYKVPLSSCAYAILAADVDFAEEISN